MISDERIKKQYINEHRLEVITLLTCAMIRPEDFMDANSCAMGIDRAYEIANRILDKESDLQVIYRNGLPSRVVPTHRSQR